MSMTIQTRLPLASGTVTASATAIPDIGLPAEIAAWLTANHQHLASEIARTQRAAERTNEDEATIAVEELPEATRQFLWQGIRQHHPALADLLRDPVIAEARAVFSAQLRLYVADLRSVILCALRAQQEVPQDRSRHSPRF